MSRPRKTKRYSFTPTCKTLQEVLVNHELATLGDAYTNLLYSLYLSIKTGKPTGAKADSHMLSKALKQAGLREFLSSRVDRHKQADAAEALLVYVWLQSLITIEESLSILTKYDDVAEGFSAVLSTAKAKLNL
ncbi:MAG: ribonuclease III family protein [Candidatus Bathyarchaeia archaeon]